MSRVRKPGNKWGNDIKHTPEEIAPSKVVRKKMDKVDYTKATTISSWLFLKYDMSYKTYRNKSPKRRAKLLEEFLQDTGRNTSIEGIVTHYDN